MIDHLSVVPNISDKAASDEGGFCTTCGYQNPAKFDICLNCAAPLGSSCPICEQAVPADGRFCTQCGTPLPASPQIVAASQRQSDVQQSVRALMPTALAQKISAASGEMLSEHREVTVLSVRVSNIEDIRYTLDEEDVFFYYDEALRLLAEVVYKYEGTIDKFTSDGLMALFGAPVAHENDPERAVRAALEMQNIIRPWQTRILQEDGLDFQLCLGLNTGVVIVGKVGNDLHMDYTAIGETVDLASQLEVAAKSGSILVSGETYQRTRHRFTFEALPPFTIEWQAEPIQAFQPTRLLKLCKSEQALPGFQVPLSGRAKDLSRLQDTLAEVRLLDRPKVVLVSGEAGLGKSRLVAEFRRTLPSSETRVYQGSCLAYARSSPLWVVAELLRDIIGLSDTDSDEVQRETLQAYLDQLGLARVEILPYLSHVLGIAQQDPRLEARVRLIDAAMLQRQTHAALRQFFLTEAQLAPTVLIFEDLHWIDQASREFLEYLIQTADEVPLLLVLVSRPAERNTVLRPLIVTAEQEPDRLIDLQLDFLSETDGQHLVDHIIGQTTDETWSLKQRIVRRADGNPLYVEEIIRMLIDQGGLVRKPQDRIWQVTPQASEFLNAVPGTVKGLILARFDRLPERLRHTMQIATVLGPSFPLALLQDLSGTSPEALATQLRELESRQFLLAEPFRSERGYTFRHALLQETIYSTLLRRDRSKIHTKVARAIEQSSLWLPEEQAEALAYHYAESTRPTRAIPHLITAAENAARRCAYETAIEHYRRARQLLPGQPDNDGDEFFRVRIGLGRSFKFAGEFSPASEALTDVLHHLWNWSLAVEPTSLSPVLVDTIRQLADVRQREGAYDKALAYLEVGLQLLGEKVAEEHPQRWRSLLDRMAWIRFRQGQLEEAFALVSEALVDLNSKDMDDPIRLASLYNTLGGVSWQQGQLDEATTYVEQSLHLYGSVGYLWGTATAYGNLGILYYGLGKWPTATHYYEQAYAVQQVIGNPEGQASSYDNLGILRLAMGEHELAKKELESGLAIRQRLGDVWGTAQSYVNLAHLAIVEARPEEAATYAETALNLSETIGSTEIQIQALWILALVESENNQLQQGLRTATQALAMAQSAGLVEKETDCLRVLGMLSAQAGQYQEAVTQLRQSIDLSIKQNDPYLQGKALLELGHLYRSLANSDQPTKGEWRSEALKAYDEAVRKFELLGARYDLHLAQGALSQLQTHNAGLD